MLLLMPAIAQAWPESVPRPSYSTRQENTVLNSARVSVNEQTIELSLSDAIYLGLRDNRSIRSIYLDRIAQKFELRVAEDSFTPKLIVSTSYRSLENQDDRYRQGTMTPETTLLTPYGTRVSLGWTGINTNAKVAGRSQNDGVSFSVIQPLLKGAGKDITTAPVRIARLNEQINRLTLKHNVMQTVTKIITSYRELLLAQEQIKLAGDSLSRSRQLLEVNQNLIFAGRMAEFEIVQTEADVASLELALEDARNQLGNAQLALLQLLAIDLNTPVVASDTLMGRRVTIDAAQAFHQAERSQPAWLSQLIAGEQAEIQLSLAKNNRLWDISVVGGASQISDRSDQNGSSRSWEKYIGVQVEIPVGDLRSRQAEVQSQINARTLELQQEEAHQQLKREINNAVRDIDTRWRQYEISLRVIELSRRKLEIEREKLTVGRSSNFQVLSYESDLRNAENSRLNTLITYLNAQTQLDLTLGTALQSWDITLNE